MTSFTLYCCNNKNMLFCGVPNPSWYNFNTTLRLKATEHRCLDIKVALMKSHQYGCLNKTSIITTPVDMAIWNGKFHMAPPTREKLSMVSDCGERESQYLPRTNIHV